MSNPTRHPPLTEGLPLFENLNSLHPLPILDRRSALAARPL
jgi:hypothetical protein